MEEAHSFRVVAWWTSGRTGIVKSSSAPNAIHFTAPSFGGPDGRWTPEDLLLAAIGSCYTTTFRVIAENSKFEYTDLQVEVEAAIKKGETGYGVGAVLIRANLMIGQDVDQGLAIRILQEAKGLCMVSRALAVEPRFESRVQVRGPGIGVGRPLAVADKPVSDKEDYR